MKKRVLVFGSNGFIGATLVKSLVNKDYLVDGVGRTSNKNKQVLNEYFIFKDSHEFFEELLLTKYDACVNCAGLAKVSDSFKFPNVDFNLNVNLVFNILNAIKASAQKPYFVNLSSAAVYGNPIALPILETHRSNPISPYGFHKLIAENVVDSFVHNFGLNAVSLRIFSAFGSGLEKQLFWDLFQKCESNNSITLFGTGEESRDFIEVRDLVYIIEQLVEKQPRYKQVNVANGIEWKLKDVAKIFAEQYSSITGKKINFKFNNEHDVGAPKNWCADIQILKELGYKPKVQLEEGINSYIKWCVLNNG